MLDERDAGFWRMQFWQDRNRDGYASRDELQTLSQAHVQSISLVAVTAPGTIAGVSNVKGVPITYEDGHTRTLWDLPLQRMARASCRTGFLRPGLLC